MRRAPESKTQAARSLENWLGVGALRLASRSRSLRACEATSTRFRETRAAADSPSSGGRSKPGDTLRSWKAGGAIHRREFVPRDGRIDYLRGATGGVCHDGRRSNRVLLAAGAEEQELQPVSRRAEPAGGRGRARGGAFAIAVRLKPDTTYEGLRVRYLRARRGCTGGATSIAGGKLRCSSLK